MKKAEWEGKLKRVKQPTTNFEPPTSNGEEELGTLNVERRTLNIEGVRKNVENRTILLGQKLSLDMQPKGCIYYARDGCSIQGVGG
jgi:hypothetical protein